MERLKGMEGAKAVIKKEQMSADHTEWSELSLPPATKINNKIKWTAVIWTVLNKLFSRRDAHSSRSRRQRVEWMGVLLFWFCPSCPVATRDSDDNCKL